MKSILITICDSNMLEDSEPTREKFQAILTQVLARAKDSLVEAKYDESESAYKEALKLARTLYTEPSSDTATCLLGIGDSYYAADRFEEARDAYRELLTEYENMEKFEAKDKVSALFRLAKTLTVLKEFTKADQCFAETVALAEPELPLGHPLLTGIYESYANMLAKGHLDPGSEREEFFREKARVCRLKFTPPKRPPLRPQTVDLSKIRKLEKARKPTGEDNSFVSKAAGALQSPMYWLGRNQSLVLILLLVSLIAYSFTDKTIRSHLYKEADRWFPHH